jgi:hypothetical protein
MKKLIFLISLLFSLNSCEKENTKSYSSEVFGEWQWVSTCGGFSGLCNTPENSNSSSVIEFNRDSTLYIYQNNALINSSQYYILQTPTDNNTGRIVLSDSIIYDYSILHDNLNFTPHGADFVIAYKRK